MRLLAGVLVLATGSPVYGMPLFASPPHFVDGAEGRQIVFFLNEPVEGALAVQAGSEVVEVIVPGSRVDPTMQGDRFRDRETKVRAVALRPTAHGATAIRIETSGAIGGANAQPLDDPPRLIIALGGDEQPPRPARRDPPVAVAQAAPEPRQRLQPEVAAPAAPSVAEGVPEPTGSPAPASTPVPSPTPVAAASPAARSVGVQIAAALRSEEATPVLPPPVVPRDDSGLPCLWRRWYGVPFCAPDPALPAYAAHPGEALIAASLATPGEQPRQLAANGEPARDYLWADGIYVAQAESGRMLSAIQAYRQVLRRHPEFIDAPRARTNIALAHRAMGFESELRAAARNIEGTPTGTLLRALAGNVALEAGALERARDDYASVADAGPLGACLAVRGSLAIALEGGGETPDGGAAAELTERCPRAVVDDPETRLLVARLRLANGDPEGAATLLSGLRERVPARSRARVVATEGAAAELAGDRDAARKLYQKLAAGAYGARAAQSASARLALLDAADGNLETGLKRLQALEPSSTHDARRALVVRALSTVDGPASASEAIAVAYDARIGHDDLPVGARIDLARAYRELGLLTEAAHALDAARADAGAGVSAALWEESARVAQAQRGWPAVLQIAEAWRATATPPPAAEVLHAQALAGIGRSRPALEALARAATRLAPGDVRDLRMELGTLLRTHDATTAQRLLEEAALADVRPPLTAAQAAGLLWTLGDLAEANGDTATAQAAFARLTRYEQEPAAALAAYRLGRLTAPTRSARAYDEAATARDALERRAAEAAHEYEALVATLAREEAR